MKHKQYTVARYLIERLQRVGIRHLFGVPGDYVLNCLVRKQPVYLELPADLAHMSCRPPLRLMLRRWYPMPPGWPNALMNVPCC